MTFNAPFATLRQAPPAPPRFYFEAFPARRDHAPVAWTVRDMAGNSLGMVVLDNTGSYGAYRGTIVVGSFATQKLAGAAIEQRASGENAA